MAIIRQNNKGMEHKTLQSLQSLQLATYKSDANTHTDPSTQLDLQYLNLREQIITSHYYSRLSKHLLIRLNGWMQKLDQIISNSVWKRNRNNYAKLMNLMCECEVVVEPFHTLPPQGDVPKLGKHEINKIIDQVQRQVKLEKTDCRANIKEKYERPNPIKPQQYWSLIRKANNHTKQNNHDEESIFMGKFTSVEEKLKDPLIYSQIEAGFHSLTDENPSLKISEEKKCYSSLFNKDSNKKMASFDQKQNLSLTKSFAKPPKHIMVSLNPKSTPILSQKRAFEGEFREITIEPQHSRLQAFRDDHISMDLQNQTLKTEMFDPDLSIHPHMPDFNISLDCDYSDQLSERVRMPQERQTYFEQKMKERPGKYLPLLPN